MTLLPAVSSLGVMVMFAERSAVSGLSATATVSVVSPSVPSVAERVIHSLAASSAPGHPLARSGHLHALACGALGLESQYRRVHRQRIDLRIFGALLDDGDASVFYPVVVLRLEGNGGGSLFRFGVVGNGDRQLFVGQPFDCHPLLSAFCERVCPLHADGRYGNRLWGGILRCEGERCGGYFERSGCCFRFSGLACGCQYACRCDEQYLFHHSFVF